MRVRLTKNPFKKRRNPPKMLNLRKRLPYHLWILNVEGDAHAITSKNKWLKRLKIAKPFRALYVFGHNAYYCLTVW